jgi:hypothetical protein
MVSRLFGLALACALLSFGAGAPVLAQATTAAPGGTAAAPAPAQEPSTKPSRRSRAKASKSETDKKEPTVGQMAGRDRMRKCAKEWKDLKAANKVESGMRWPKFYSQCNTRLKEQKA